MIADGIIHGSYYIVIECGVSHVHGIQTSAPTLIFTHAPSFSTRNHCREIMSIQL